MTTSTSTILAYVVIGALLWGYAAHLLVALLNTHRPEISHNGTPRPQAVCGIPTPKSRL